MDYYSAIQQKFGFVIPEPYRELERRGFLALDGPASVAEMMKPGSGYLYLYDMEWYTPQQILEYELDEYHLPGFVPFAFTGRADHWCWQPDCSTDRGTRVVLCPHDYELATIYAPDFVSAAYRHILEYTCYGVDSSDDESVIRAFLDRWIVDLRDVLQESWCERISLIRDKKLAAWSMPGAASQGLITEDELQTIVTQDIAYPDMDQEIQWMRP